MVDFYAALILFSFTAAITPGPNNISIMMSSSTHGIKKTMPHYWGIVLGYPLMLFIVGCGLGAVFIKYPLIHNVIRIVGSAYILYMAWKIINASIVNENNLNHRPLTFIQSLLFQWINPKCVVTTISVISTYTKINSPVSMILQVSIITLIGIVATFIAASTWIFGGAILHKLLKNNVHLKIFNWIMGGLLILSILLMLIK